MTARYIAPVSSTVETERGRDATRDRRLPRARRPVDRDDVRRSLHVRSGQPREIVGELRVRRRDRTPAPHGARAVDRVGRDRRRHRDAVVAVALERRRLGGAPPRTTRPSARASTASPSCESSCCSAPIRLLSFTAQLGRVAHLGDAVGERGRDRERGDLVDVRDLVAVDRRRRAAARRARAGHRPARRSRSPGAVDLDVARPCAAARRRSRGGSGCSETTRSRDRSRA